MKDLEQYGWSATFEEDFSSYRQAGFSAGRISVENREQYLVLTAEGEVSAAVTGKLLYTVDAPSDLPKVGDWVVITLYEPEQKAVIHAVLPRQSRLSRKTANRKSEEQIIVANIDMIFVVQSLDHNFNLSRLERYLVQVRDGGAQPVIILNKADLCPEPAEKIGQVRAIAPDATILSTSAKTEDGVAAVQAFLRPGLTYAFVGSSGVGKSTLINRLIGANTLKTAAVREKDSKGGHTTTRRELIPLDNGAILIDTPGMRELALWDSGEGLDDTFADILQLAQQCRFADCRHISETGCAVREAVEQGALSAERYKNYTKLLRETAYLDSKRDERSFLDSKRKDKELHRAIKNYRKTPYAKK